MKTWEIVVDVHVRKTLCFSGPESEAEARMIIAAYARPGSLPIATLQKFGPDMRPVEELIGAAEVVSVKEVRQ